MFWFLNQILGALVGEILYPLLITAPLHILNGIYQAFSFCCGANLGEILFNSQQGKMVIDVNAPLFKFLISAIIISLVLLVVFILALTIEHLATKKKVNFLSKIKWPLLAITSTVTIPIAFILISSLSSVLMELVGGTTIHYYIEAAKVGEIFTNMSRGIEGLAQSFSIEIQLTDKDSQLVTVQLYRALDLIQQAIINVQKEAAAGNLQDLVEKCSRALEYISNVRNADIGTIQSQFESVLTYIRDNVQAGHVIAKGEISRQLQDVMTNLTNIQNSWSLILSNIPEILKQAESYSFHCLDEYIKFGEHDIQIRWLFNSFARIIANPWTTQDNIWLEFNKFWVEGTGDEQISLLSVMLNGGEWSGVIGGMSQKVVVETSATSLNYIVVALDPSQANTFNLVVKIYQIVTGNKDANWTWTMPWNMSRGVNLINVGVGFIIIVGAIFVCGLFGLMAARRFIELAVLAVWSVVAAIMGVKDDGAKFNNTVKLIIVKMFCIVISWAAFSLAICLLDNITNWIDAQHSEMDKGGLAWGAITAIITVGGLLGAYHMSLLLQQWMGDSTSLQGTLADMGAMGAMMGAGKAVGAVALLGKGIGKGVGAGKKRRASNNEKKFEFKSLLAEKQGLGKAKYEMDSKGKMKFAGFKLDEKMKGSKDAFNSLKFDKKEFKLWKKANK